MQAFDINFDLDKVSVTSITASDWTTTDGGTITSTSTMIKKATGGTWATSPDGTIKEVYIGDIYYSDGSWSSTYDSSKTPIGVVVSTNPDYCEKAKGYGHGLVMALKNASTSATWGPKTTNEESLDDKNILSKFYNDVSGLKNTKAISDAHTSSTFQTDYPAFYAAINYTVAFPPSCSGWFLPSIGQWWDVLERAAAYNGSSLGLSECHAGNVPGYNVANEAPIAAAAFNHLFSHSLSPGLYDIFYNNTTERYWSSSENADVAGDDLSFFNYEDRLSIYCDTKTNAHYVRSFLAF